MGLLKELFGPSEGEVWKQFADETGAEFVRGGLFRRDRILAKMREWTITFDTYSATRRSGSTEGGHRNTYHYIRVRAPLVVEGGLQFAVYRQAAFSPLGKLLSAGSVLGMFLQPLGRAGEGTPWLMQDMKSGYPDLDRDFTIKGSDESIVRALFVNQRIRELMQAEPSILLLVQRPPRRLFSGHSPSGVHELYLEVPGRIKDAFGELYLETPTGTKRFNPPDVEDRKSLVVRRLKTLHELFEAVLNQLWSTGHASPATSVLP